MQASDHAVPRRPPFGGSVWAFLSPRGRLGYGVLSFGTALITSVVAVRAGQAFGPSAGLLWAILLTAAFVWHLISARRVAATRLWALHAAPYLSAVAFWGLNLLYGAYPTGTALATPEPSILVKALAVVTPCGVFSWPTASLALAIAPARGQS